MKQGCHFKESNRVCSFQQHIYKENSRVCLLQMIMFTKENWNFGKLVFAFDSLMIS